MDHLTWYIFKYYSHLLTVDEREAWLSAMKEAKARSGFDSITEAFRDKPEVVEAFRNDKANVSAEALEQRNANPRVKSLMANGATAFYQCTCDRILREHGKEIYFNRCPKCNALAKTPTAKQCRECFYSWHEGNR